MCMCSESAAYGGELVDGRGVGGAGEGLCERAAAVRFDYTVENTSQINLYSDRFMIKERERLFQREYESASMQYQNISRS